MKKRRPASQCPPLTYERAQALVELIIPLPGCEGIGTEPAALALDELIAGLTGPKEGRAEDAADLALAVSVAAFNQTMSHHGAWQAWRGRPFESALKGGK